MHKIKLLTALLALVTVASPHGSGGPGVPAPPPPAGTPSPPPPGPPPPPPAPGTPGPGSPSSPGAPRPADAPPKPGTPASGGGARTPASPGPSSPSGPGGGPQAPTTPTASSVDPTSWTYWWYYNSRQYLDVKDAIHDPGVVTRSDEFYLGRGQSEERGADTRPSSAVVQGEIVPYLLSLLETETSNHILTSAMLALAKLTDPADEGSREIQQAIVPFVAHSHQTIAEVATIALGILGREDAAPLLAHVFADDDAGRRLVDDSRVSERTRAFAGFALGLVGARTVREDVRRFVVSSLMNTYEQERGGSRQVRIAALTAIGGVPLDAGYDAPTGATSARPAMGREAQVRWLLAVLDDAETPHLVRAHAPTALARLLRDTPDGAPLRAQVLTRLTAALGTHSKAEREVQMSCAQALGLTVDLDADALDAAGRQALLTAHENVVDQQTRTFAMIALARIGGRPGSGAGDSEAGLPEIRRHLIERLDGKSYARPWAALSLGVLQRARADAGLENAAADLALLRERLLAAKAPELTGALCIALGIAQDAHASEALLATARRVRQTDVRGFALLALGMTRSRSSIAEIRSVIEEARFQPQLVHMAALGLVLMRDRGLAPLLADMLEKAGSLSSQGAVCYALGRVGDARSIGVLLSWSKNRGLVDRARGMAAEALGAVADKDRFPWNTAMSIGVNYRANSNTLSHPVVPGVLDMY